MSGEWTKCGRGRTSCMEETRELFTGGMLLLTGLIMASGSEGPVLVLSFAVVAVGLWCIVAGVIVTPILSIAAGLAGGGGGGG